MKRIVLAQGMALLLAASWTARAHAGDANIMQSLRFQYDTTSGVVMAMAEAIPESKYDFKPTPEVRTFREQFQHLTQENNNYVNLMLGQDTGDQARFFQPKTRAELMKALQESYDRGKKVLAGMTDEQAVEMVSIAPDAPAGIRGQKKTKWSIIVAVMIDNMDHYGNLVVYARLNGIVPPRTAARQQPAQK
jgi:uncharacterized damage-inducible protein DinB